MFCVIFTVQKYHFQSIDFIDELYEYINTFYQKLLKT